MPFANTRYVAADGNDGNDGLTRETAWLTFAKGVADAPNDCEILHYADTHTLGANTVVFPAADLRLFRAVEPVSIVFSGTQAQPGITITAATNQEVRGFRIASTVAGRPEFHIAGAGNGLSFCRIEKRLQTGPAVLFEGPASAAGCFLRYTLCETAGLGASNYSGPVALGQNMTSVEIDHCTLVDYGPGTNVLEGAAVFLNAPAAGAVVTLKNSILASQGVTSKIINARAGWTTDFVLKYAGNNNVLSRHLGAGEIGRVDPGLYTTIVDWQGFVAPDDAVSIDADPLWVDAGAGDYRLQAASPAATLDDAGAAAGAFGVVPGAAPRRRPGVLNPLLGIGV